MKTTKRTSFDLDVENSDNLKEFAEKMGSNLSAVVNYMLRITLSASPEVRRAITDFCNTQREDLKRQSEGMSAFEKQNYIKPQREYQELAYFFSVGLDASQTRGADPMKKVYLKEGYVLIPSDPDWILLDNFKDPKECMYAGVVEVRQPLDGSKTYEAKHYVFCSDYRYGSDYPAGMDDEVYSAACEKDPAFKDILNAVVTPKYNGKECFANMINVKEYGSAPTPGLFHIVEQGDPTYWNKLDPDFEPPFGCMIVRK